MREGWERVALKAVLRQIRRPIEVAGLAEVPFAGVRWYAEGVYARNVVPAREVKTKVLNRLEAGDITYNRMWATKASFGRARQDVDGCMVTNDFPIFTVDTALILGEYLDLIFKTEAFQREASSRATGTTERRRLKEPAFLAISIGLPPLAEQRRIVDLIAALDEAIEAGRSGWNASDELYKMALAEMSDGRYPMVKVKDAVVKARAGGTPSRKDATLFGRGTPWLKSGEVDCDFIRGAGEEISDAGLWESSAWLVPAGSTLVAMYGQGNTKGTAGWLEVDLATNQAVLALVPDETITQSRFLLHALRSRTASLRLRAVGAAQPNLSKELVMDENMPLPLLSVQVEISARLDAIRALQAACFEFTESLVELRAELLSVLLSGERGLPASYERFIIASAGSPTGVAA